MKIKISFTLKTSCLTCGAQICLTFQPEKRMSFHYRVIKTVKTQTHCWNTEDILSEGESNPDVGFSFSFRLFN